jgi:hypothetical protein
MFRAVTAIPDTSSRRADMVTTNAALGAEGNERLTAWTGAALLLGFAAEGLTITDVHWYMKWHVLIGYALLVPVTLKVCSTGYRFARYYTNTPAYRRKGPPKILLRVLGPFVVLLTLAVLGSGVGIMVLGGTSLHRPLEMLHKASFILWFGVTTIHVLAYVWRIPRLMLADVLGRGTPRTAALQRIGLSVGAGLLGIGLAAALMPWVDQWVSGR